MVAASRASRIENVTRRDLGKRLRQIAGTHFPEERINRRDLSHLVQVVTNEALFLTDLYARVALDDILERQPPELSPRLRHLLERPADGDPSRLLFEVRRLPERIKVVGDKCLLDVGLIGQRQYRGIPLVDLGQRSYQVASQVLARLAEDPTLTRFFSDNRLGALSIEEEITFLDRCGRRFALYARVLSWLGAADDRVGVVSARPAPPLPAPPPNGAAGEEAGAGAGAEAEGQTALISSESPPRERLYLSQDELLAAYERILLFSALDIAELARRLGSAVIGQEEAIRALCDEFSLYAAGTQNLNRPPSYLFVGPTGVGKNYLVETLRDRLEAEWEIAIPFLTLEGPNYTYPSDINELRGATRGFIRSDEDGLLTEFHKQASTAPLSIILIDEVEKAHPQLRRFFLSIMDRGTVTDNRGRVLQFANCMLIYTSNIGYSVLAQGAAPIGYQDRAGHDRRMDQDARRELRRCLSPEFINRLRVVHFEHLGPSAIDRIFDLELARIGHRFQEVHGLGLEVTPAARAEILRRGYSHDYGARHLRARLETLVNVEVSRKIKTDEDRGRPGTSRVLRYLRELKGGKRAVDVEKVRSRVMRQARARVEYCRVRIDFRDGAFDYAGLDA